MLRRLTTPDDWDGYIRRQRLPRANDARRMPWRAIDRVLCRYLPSAPADVVEVGCAASAWLPYFAAQGHRCFGVDYSPIGCRLAVANLRHYGAEARVWSADAFAPGLGAGRFDVVFSNGFVEHFDAPGIVLRALADLARPGGLVVTLVPNLAGLAGHGFRRLNPNAFAAHLVIRPADLAAAHAAAGLDSLHAGYAGIWFPHLWFALPAHAAPALRFALKAIVHGTAYPLWAGTAALGWYPESRLGSPYVLAIARRPTTDTRRPASLAEAGVVAPVTAHDDRRPARRL